MNPKFSDKGCDVLNITYLCFADDLMLFCCVKESSLVFLQEALDIYAKWSGLKTNDKKSHIFFSGDLSHLHKKLADGIGFSISSFLIKYLGILLIFTKLRKNDCKPLIKRIFTWVEYWKNRFLSNTRRLILIKSIPFSIQVY